MFIASPPGSRPHNSISPGAQAQDNPIDLWHYQRDNTAPVMETFCERPGSS